MTWGMQGRGGIPCVGISVDGVCGVTYYRHSTTFPIIQDLRLLLETYSHPQHPYLFPSRHLNHHSLAHEPRSRLTPVPKSLRESRHHRRFYPQPQTFGTHPDEQRRDSAADYSRNQRPPQRQNSCSATKELGPEQVRGAISSLSMLSNTGKRSLPRWQRSPSL